MLVLVFSNLLGFSLSLPGVLRTVAVAAVVFRLPLVPLDVLLELLLNLAGGFEVGGLHLTLVS